jgi:RimJ/RimL family protein N-acetyltransferase
MQTLATDRLDLEPLVVAHAELMFGVLGDLLMYRWLDDAPPLSIETLQARYAKLETRQNPDGTERWLNWIVRLRGGDTIGYVQATVMADTTAWVGYALASPYCGRGHATEATRRMVAHLEAEYGVTRLLATVEVDNERSIRLLQRLGFRPGRVDESAAHRLTASERLYVRESPVTGKVR